MAKYNKTLDTVGKLKDGEYYKYDIKKGFTAVNPNDIIYKTHSIDSLYSYYKSYVEIKKELENMNKLLLESINNRLSESKFSELQDTISKCVKVLNDLTLNVDGLNIIHVNENGYVERFLNTQGIITLKDVETPLDVELGYYKVKLDNDEVIFILDKNKYESEWL